MPRTATWILLAIIFWPACSSPLSTMRWIEGKWMMEKAKGGERWETWRKENRWLMTGKGLKVAGQDTTLLEYLELSENEKEIWYIPTVPDQNNAEPVPFKLVNHTDRDLIFENREHDFPQRILYHYLPAQRDEDADSLHVRVESLDGKGIDYRFKRMK